MLDELYIAYSTVVVGGLFWKKKCALIIGIGYLAMHCSSSEWYVMLMCFGQYLSGPGLPQAEAVSYCHLAEPSEMRVVCWRAERAFLSLFELKQQRKLLYAITREHVIRHHWHAMSIGTPTFYWQLCTQRAVYSEKTWWIAGIRGHVQCAVVSATRRTYCLLRLEDDPSFLSMYANAYKSMQLFQLYPSIFV